MQNLNIYFIYSAGPDVTKAMTEVLLNMLEEDIYLREDGAKALEVIMKESGSFPTEIREYLADVLPPEPEFSKADLERMKAEDDAREAEEAKKALEGSSSSGEDFVDEGGVKKGKLYTL